MDASPESPVPNPLPVSAGMMQWLRYSRYDWRDGRNPKSLAVARALSEQLDRWFAKTGPAPETADLVAALRAGGSVVPIWACGVMSLVCEFQEEPVAYALAVFRASTAPARAWMMRFFRGPDAAGRAIVEAALRDKSARVREWACEGAEYFQSPRFAPILDELANADPNPHVRWAATRMVSILTRGYAARLDDDGNWEIEVSLCPGSTNHEWVPAETVTRLGIDEVARLLRNDPYNTILQRDPDRPTFGTSVAR